MRKLSLVKDVLSELSTDELVSVVGAAATAICLTDPCITRPVSKLDCTFSLGEGFC